MQVKILYNSLEIFDSGWLITSQLYCTLHWICLTQLIMFQIFPEQWKPSSLALYNLPLSSNIGNHLYILVSKLYDQKSSLKEFTGDSISFQIVILLWCFFLVSFMLKLIIREICVQNNWGLLMKPRTQLGNYCLRKYIYLSTSPVDQYMWYVKQITENKIQSTSSVQP